MFFLSWFYLYIFLLIFQWLTDTRTKHKNPFQNCPYLNVFLDLFRKFEPKATLVLS